MNQIHAEQDRITKGDEKMEITSVPETKQMLWWGHWEEPRKFYTKYLDVEGIAIIGSDGVSNNTFYRAKDIVLKVTSKHLQFRRDLSGARIMLAARGTWIQNLPELREYRDSPLGCSHISRDGVVYFCASVVEWEGRPNMGIFSHELGHAIVPSICRLEHNFQSLVNQAYGRATALRTWEDPRMSTNMWEYWAEGVKLWTHDIGTGRQFETKDAFIEHDPGLAGILDNWLHVGDIAYEY